MDLRAVPAQSIGWSAASCIAVVVVVDIFYCWNIAIADAAAAAVAVEYCIQTSCDIFSVPIFKSSRTHQQRLQALMCMCI